MAKRYYRKNNSSEPNGWVEMTGKEFYQFVQDPRNRGRYFIDMGDVVLETTESTCREHKAEENHHTYLLKQQEGVEIVSLQSKLRGESMTVQDIVADQTQEVEAAAVRSLLMQEMYAALRQLPEDERGMIYILYLNRPQKTISELSRESGIPLMTLQNKKLRILAKLRRSLKEKP